MIFHFECSISYFVFFVFVLYISYFVFCILFLLFVFGKVNVLGDQDFVCVASEIHAGDSGKAAYSSFYSFD